MSKDKVRIRLKSFDHRSVDQACSKIVETVKRTGGVVSGPVPLPTEIEKITILRAVHKYKDSREQFEIRTHKRLIDIDSPSKETIDALAHMDLPRRTRTLHSFNINIINITTRNISIWCRNIS